MNGAGTVTVNALALTPGELLRDFTSAAYAAALLRKMAKTAFKSADSFAPSSEGYRLMPFWFMRNADGTVLVTNECGEFELLSEHSFHAFATHELRPDEPDYQNLKAKHFLADTDARVPMQLLATKVRTKRSFLEGFTRLHLFVTTLRCDHTCPYCQVSRVTQDRAKFDMRLRLRIRLWTGCFVTGSGVED